MKPDSRCTRLRAHKRVTALVRSLPVHSGLVKGKFNAKEQCSLALEVRRRSWDIIEFQRSRPIIVLSQMPLHL